MNRPFIILLACGWSLLLHLPPAASAAEHLADDIARWVESESGEVVRDNSGRITEVDLSHTWTVDAELKRLQPLAPHLKRLDLSLTYVSDRGLEYLRSFTALKDLNLFAAEFITDAGVAFLRESKGLERLNLRGTDITDVSMEYIATMTGLTSLDVSFTQVNDTGLDHLASLTRLESLTAGGNKVTGNGLHVLKLLPNLTSLDLKGVQRRNAGDCWSASVTDLDMQLIGSLPRLEQLVLGRGTGLSPGPSVESDGNSESECRITGGIKITNLGLKRLNRLESLKLLDISGSSITADGVTSLAAFPQLEHLNLWGVAAMDDTAASRIVALRALKSLDLTDTPITDKTLEQLAAMSGLQRLYISGTRVTSQGIRQFQIKNPSCQLSWRSGFAGDPNE